MINVMSDYINANIVIITIIILILFILSWYLLLIIYEKIWLIIIFSSIETNINKNVIIEDINLKMPHKNRN